MVLANIYKALDFFFSKHLSFSIPGCMPLSFQTESIPSLLLKQVSSDVNHTICRCGLPC